MHHVRVAGLTGARPAVVTARPCRALPQTISAVGLIGGGQVPTPRKCRGRTTASSSWMSCRSSAAMSSRPSGSHWRRVSPTHLSRAPLISRAGPPGHVGSDAQPLTSATPCSATAISQMCRFTGCWPSLFAPWTEAASASVRDDDQPVHPCTAAESAAHARRWPRGLAASPMGMYTAAQPRHAT
jgi:hypothetical protein